MRASSGSSSLAPGAAVLPFSRVDQSRADGAVCHGPDVWGPFMLRVANPSWSYIGRGLYHRCIPFRCSTCAVLLKGGGRFSWQNLPHVSMTDGLVFGTPL